MKLTANKFLLLLFAFAFIAYNASSQPTVEQFKQVFEAHMQKLKPEGTTKRTIIFQDVVKGKASGGYYSFKVNGYVHDYGPGYPANHYYGQTCLGIIDGLNYDMLKDNFGSWIVQGRFTVTESYKDCKDNTSAGAAAIPLSSVPGKIYEAGKDVATGTRNTTENKTVASTSNLYIGQYACYGSGNRLMAGMDFILKPNFTYGDLDGKRGGSYVYNTKNATISFYGGFLSGQVGRNVKLTGFQLSNTVTAEPWR